MNKIIDVIKNMITNSDKISNIEKDRVEYYFLYKGYVWSIWEWSNDEYTGHSLAYYPGFKNVSDTINSIPKHDFIVYSSGDFISGEASSLFAQLYSIVKEKFYGVDKMFNDILNA